jgi:hypothetical protein
VTRGSSRSCVEAMSAELRMKYLLDFRRTNFIKNVSSD